MTRSIRRALVITLALVAVSCVAVFAAALPPVWPVQVQQARARWQRQQISHYTVDVSWADGWSVGHARVEMRDGLFVGAIDLDTGKPLHPSKHLAASYFASVDQVFRLVEERVWPSLNWRILLGRYHPMLRRWLRPCLPPLSSVSFDRERGYPTAVFYNNSWCNRTTFFTYSQVRLSNLTPVP